MHSNSNHLSYNRNLVIILNVLGIGLNVVIDKNNQI